MAAMCCLAGRELSAKRLFATDCFAVLIRAIPEGDPQQPGE